MDTEQILTEYYSNYNEDGRLGSRHGSVEYLTTMRYIEKYLRPGMCILEIGAGTGRYSHTLARMGYSVTAVELVPHNIEIFMKNTVEGERISIAQGNAKNLDMCRDDRFDITLLLGPMYHLFTWEEQRQALSEALRVTKPGGVIFVAYCGNDATVFQFCFRRGMLQEERYQKLVDPVTFKAGLDPSELFALYRREDIDELMEGLPVQRLHYVGTDLLTNHMRQEVDAMEDSFFQTYLNYHFAVCERPDLVGISHHILDVFRKA